MSRFIELRLLLSRENLKVVSFRKVDIIRVEKEGGMANADAKATVWVSSLSGGNPTVYETADKYVDVMEQLA